MTDTFKSGQRRICSGCLGSIEPRDRVCLIYDEIHCMDCLTEHEEKAVNELTRLSQEMERMQEHGSQADSEGDHRQGAGFTQPVPDDERSERVLSDESD